MFGRPGIQPGPIKAITARMVEKASESGSISRLTFFMHLPFTLEDVPAKQIA